MIQIKEKNQDVKSNMSKINRLKTGNLSSKSKSWPLLLVDDQIETKLKI